MADMEDMGDMEVAMAVMVVMDMADIGDKIDHSECVSKQNKKYQWLPSCNYVLFKIKNNNENHILKATLSLFTLFVIVLKQLDAIANDCNRSPFM